MLRRTYQFLHLTLLPRLRMALSVICRGIKPTETASRKTAGGNKSYHQVVQDLVGYCRNLTETVAVGVIKSTVISRN